MFLAKAIERIDPTRGNNATPKEEIAIRPLKMEQSQHTKRENKQKPLTCCVQDIVSPSCSSPDCKFVFRPEYHILLDQVACSTTEARVVAV